MRCKDAQTVLSAWIDNELEKEAQTALESHLRLCRVCDAEARMLSGLSHCLETHHRSQPSPTLQKRIMAKFMEETGSPSLGHWWAAFDWELKVSMAASAVIGLFIGLQLGGEWTGSQLLSKYSLSGFIFSAGDLLLTWT